ncbi:MAG: divalent metal cation transporter, partial [Planctomycetota bacterium]
MPEQLAKVEADRQAIIQARQKGPLATAKTYLRLSGPGWLQSALTLGGGSLGSSLYLGVLAGFTLLWLQPFAMILGIIMLSAIGYVAMSTKERPFRAINRHINPVLGWGWALASLLANMVWALPQYSLASGVLQQNLLPEVLGKGSPMGDFWGKVAISAAILLITLAITWAYDSGGWGIRLYELLLKLVVAGIVACFVGVVIVVTLKGDLNWGDVWRGFIPDVTKLWKPAATFNWLLEAVPNRSRDFWTDLIVDQQRDVIFSAAATAVGINMTFLLPYSMLRRGWDKEFRGLAKFD